MIERVSRKLMLASSFPPLQVWKEIDSLMWGKENFSAAIGRNQIFCSNQRHQLENRVPITKKKKNLK